MIKLEKNYKAIVNNLNGDNSYLIDKTDIEEVVALYDLIVYDISEELEFFTSDAIKELQKDFDNELFDFIDLTDYLSDTYKREFKIYILKEVEVYQELEVLSLNYDNEIVKECLSDYNSDLSFQYWDGSNWIIKYIESNYYVINWNECIWISLDNWTGNNWQFGNVGIHCQVSKNPHNSNEYLVYTSSQYQGDLSTCEIMNIKELESFLSENDRSEYLEEIIKS